MNLSRFPSFLRPSCSLSLTFISFETLPPRTGSSTSTTWNPTGDEKRWKWGEHEQEGGEEVKEGLLKHQDQNPLIQNADGKILAFVPPLYHLLIGRPSQLERLQPHLTNEWHCCNYLVYLSEANKILEGWFFFLQLAWFPHSDTNHIILVKPAHF